MFESQDPPSLSRLEFGCRANGMFSSSWTLNMCRVSSQYFPASTAKISGLRRFKSRVSLHDAQIVEAVGEPFPSVKAAFVLRSAHGGVLEALQVVLGGHRKVIVTDVRLEVLVGRVKSDPARNHDTQVVRGVLGNEVELDVESAEFVHEVGWIEIGHARAPVSSIGCRAAENDKVGGR